MIDPIKAARLHITLGEKSEAKQVFQAHLPHEVKPREQFDPSLTNRFVYGNRADWYAAAAIARWFDADAPLETERRRFLMPSEIQAAAADGRKTGMTLYE